MNTQYKQLTRKDRGFTIIEVVLVLAIAGLIFLMVFLALPALQRGQRDTQRKEDLSRFLSQVTSYQSNNKSAVPTAATVTTSSGTACTTIAVSTFITNYLEGTSFADPQTGSLYCVVSSSGTAPTIVSSGSYTGGAIINYAVGSTASCSSGAPTASGTGRKIAVSVALEGGGAYCQTN